MFKSRQRLQVQLSNQVYVQGMMLSIHSVHENIAVAGEPKARPPMVATNVYLRTGSGWRLLVHQEVESLGAPPTTTPGTGKECVNPCKSLPYQPKTDSERAVVAAYQELETSSHAADANTWGTHVADEFVVVSSNSDKVLDKETRLAGLRKSSFGGVSPTALVSAKLFDFGDGGPT